MPLLEGDSSSEHRGCSLCCLSAHRIPVDPLDEEGEHSCHIHYGPSYRFLITVSWLAILLPVSLHLWLRFRSFL